MKKLLTLIFVLGLSLPALAEEKTLICKGKWVNGESFEQNITFDPEIETINGMKNNSSRVGPIIYFIDKTKMGWTDYSNNKIFTYTVSRHDGTLTMEELFSGKTLITAKCVLFKQAF